MSPSPDRLRVLVVDDEPLSRQVVCDLLDTLADCSVVGECRDGNEALAAVEMLRPDLLFLDVRMPERDGLSVVQALRAWPRNRQPGCVFVTAFHEFATDAFNVDAIDYLVKPFTDARFFETIERVRRCFRRTASVGTDVAAADEQIVVNLGTRSIIVRVASIDWVSADGYYSRLHVGATTYLVRASLEQLAIRFGPDRFLRVHRGALVQANRIRALHRPAGRMCEVVLSTGIHIRVSERRRADVIARLQGTLSSEKISGKM
jgi:two-component system LytT family response regulator